MEKINIVEYSKKKRAHEIMAMDATFLNASEQSKEIVLHIHNFEKFAITYGYFLPVEKYLNLEPIKENGWDIEKRPTGGGIVFHAWDFSFSLIVPHDFKYLYFHNLLENYQEMSLWVQGAVEEILEKKTTLLDKQPLSEEKGQFCLAKPVRTDLVVDGKKIAGGALRKKRFGYLYQGSILLYPMEREKLEKCLKNQNYLQPLLHQNYPLFGKKAPHDQEIIRKCLIDHLQKWIASKKMAFL